MAIDVIVMKDANGVNRNIYADNDGAGNLSQVQKIGWSGDDAAPILTSHTAPFPITEGVMGGAASVGGTTSGTLDTWTVLAAADTTRRKIFIQNNSNANIQIGLGANTVMIELGPGESWHEIAYTGAINVKCASAASKTFVGYKLTS